MANYLELKNSVICNNCEMVQRVIKVFNENKHGRIYVGAKSGRVYINDSDGFKLLKKKDLIAIHAILTKSFNCTLLKDSDNTFTYFYLIK